MHSLLWFLGVSPVPDGTSSMYQLWSGFVPALAVLSLAGGIWAHFRHINCHVHRCWRIGRYTAGQYKVCKRHHPAELPERVTPDAVRHAYDASEEGIRAALSSMFKK